MSLFKNVFQSSCTLALAACAGAGLLTSSAQAQFNPVDPDPILSGSVGFTDIFVLASEAREFEALKSEGDFFNERRVRSNALDASPIENRLVTTNGSAVTDLDFKTDEDTDFTPLTIDGLGRVDGIATISSANGDEIEIPVFGIGLFREFVFRQYRAGEGGITGPAKGEGNFGPFNSYTDQFEGAINRTLDHRFIAYGGRLGFGFYLDTASAGFVVQNDPDTYFFEGSYDPNPIGMRGILVTTDGFNRAAGFSIVEIEGMLDSRGTFDTNGSSLTASPTLNFWQGDANLFSPFNAVPSSPIPGGATYFGIGFYNPVNVQIGAPGTVGFPGGYSLVQVSAATLNTPLVPVNLAQSYGLFLNTSNEVASVAAGVGSIDDFQFRDTFFAYSAPAAITVVQSVYQNPETTLFRNNTANVFE